MGFKGVFITRACFRDVILFKCSYLSLILHTIIHSVFEVNMKCISLSVVKTMELRVRSTSEKFDFFQSEKFDVFNALDGIYR